jgi:hypothetical protein
LPDSLKEVNAFGKQGVTELFLPGRVERYGSRNMTEDCFKIFDNSRLSTENRNSAEEIFEHHVMTDLYGMTERGELVHFHDVHGVKPGFMLNIRSTKPSFKLQAGGTEVFYHNNPILSGTSPHKYAGGLTRPFSWPDRIFVWDMIVGGTPSRIYDHREMVGMYETTLNASLHQVGRSSTDVLSDLWTRNVNLPDHFGLLASFTTTFNGPKTGFIESDFGSEARHVPIVRSA